MGAGTGLEVSKSSNRRNNRSATLGVAMGIRVRNNAWVTCINSRNPSRSTDSNKIRIGVGLRVGVAIDLNIRICNNMNTNRNRFCGATFHVVGGVVVVAVVVVVVVVVV